jgi:DNA polymerase-1
MGTPRAFLIDGTAFCYRAFYAISSLTTSDGRPTNAVFGFARMLQALREKEQPDYLAVAFDVGKPTRRHQKFEGYKQQRKPMPDALSAQVPLVKALLAAYRIAVFEQEGYEGEDVLATLAKRLAADGIEVFLVTGDKDALQLITSHVKVYNPHRAGQTIWDADAVRARYGVGPERMVDLMALAGDEIDNIPGVAGIGEKTAGELMRRFGDLEQLYHRLHEVDPPTRRHNLQAARQQVLLARELARIETEVPLTLRREELSPREPDWRALRELFRRLEFKQLLAQLEVQAPPGLHSALTVRSLTDAEGATPWWRAVQEGACAAIGCWPVPEHAAVLLAAAVEPATVWAGVVDAVLLETTAGRRLAEWLGDAKRPKVGHDLKTVKRLLAPLGVRLDGIIGDTMIAAHLVNSARTSPTPGDLAEDYLDESIGRLPQLEEAPRLASEALQELAPFGRCVVTSLRVHDRLLAGLEAAGLLPLYRQVELPLLDVLFQMEAAGVALDVARLEALRAEMAAKLAQLTEELHQLAGVAFNLNSPKQLAQVLFDRLGLPVIKRTKTGPSTDSEVLQQLAQRHPLPQRLMQYRELAKLTSTYVEALPKLVSSRTGRIHTCFNQTGTATGRLSSSEPNLQNIPIKTELGRLIRRAFIPGTVDGVLLAADYSQIELRILAHLSGDERLREAFRQDRDIHRFTASLIYGLPESEVQPEQRHAMKAVNYGILYGMTAHGLARELGIPPPEAQAFIEAYFARYPGIRQYLDGQIAQARQQGFVQTLLGRRRYIPELHSPDPATRQFGERMAVNAPIQGSAADLIKQAMVQLAGRLAEERLSSRLVLQVHDELILEGPRQELRATAELLRRTMEGAIALEIPLAVTVKAGPNWLDLAPV